MIRGGNMGRRADGIKWRCELNRLEVIFERIGGDEMK